RGWAVRMVAGREHRWAGNTYPGARCARPREHLAVLDALGDCCSVLPRERKHGESREGGLMVTVEQLALIMQIPPQRARRWQPALAEAMQRFGITTPRRQAHFLAQVGHESLSLSRTEESLYYTTTANLQRAFGSRIPAANLSRYLRNPTAL